MVIKMYIFIALYSVSTTVTFFFNYAMKLAGHTKSGFFGLFLLFFIVFDKKQAFNYIQGNIKRKY